MNQPKRMFGSTPRVSRRSFDRLVSRSLKSIRRTRRLKTVEFEARRDRTVEFQEGSVVLGRIAVPLRMAIAKLAPKPRLHWSLLVRPRVLATAWAVERVQCVQGRLSAA